MLSPEAATAEAQRAVMTDPRPTRVTRAFSGRPARGIVNRFLDEHSAAAPLAYPEIHHATSPLRAAARKQGDADAFNLWAGQAHELVAGAAGRGDRARDRRRGGRAPRAPQRGPAWSRYQCREVLMSRVASSASSRRIGTSVKRVIVRWAPT